MKAKERYQFYLYAYCLMANHFHLLLETRLPNISKIMHYIKGSYTTYYNIRHQRTGHLFQGRFKSIIVDKDSYLLELSRYIHLNPVRGGVVKEPDAYIWSSYRGYVGKKDEYIDYQQVRQYVNMTRNQYQRFVILGLKKSESFLNNIYAGFVLGSERFIKDILMDLNLQVIGDDVAHRRILQDDVMKSEDVIDKVTKYYKVDLETIKTSKSHPMHTKQVLIHLLHRYTGLTNREIGKLVNMRPSAVSKAHVTIAKLIETDRSMKSVIDKIISTFEG